MRLDNDLVERHFEQAADGLLDEAPVPVADGGLDLDVERGVLRKLEHELGPGWVRVEQAQQDPARYLADQHLDRDRQQAHRRQLQRRLNCERHHATVVDIELDVLRNELLVD